MEKYKQAPTYRIGLIEDEPAALDRLSRILLEVSNDVSIAWTADSVIGALEQLRHLDTYDAIITDVQLSDGSCFDLFDLFRPPCPVIFVTAYDQYAIDAFVVNAIDYLQKPLKRELLGIAIKKLCISLKAGSSQIDYDKLANSMANNSTKIQKRYIIRFGEQMRIVVSTEMAYMYTLQKGVFVVLQSGKTYPLDITLDQLERDLAPDQFFRINRQMIVSRGSIGPMQIVSKSRVQIQLTPAFHEYDCIVSTERSPLFKEWIS
jgi:two-component system, LytTR family, response regulator LytT